MPWVRFLLVLTCAVLCSARAQAAPAPIVFDFEDGLQGWELNGWAQRVQTQLIGGEWAIFGDGGIPRGARAQMSIEIDLTGIASMSVEELSVSGGARRLWWGVGGIGDTDILLKPFDLVEAGDPSLLSADLGSLTDVSVVHITWFTSLPSFTVAFIDNITFHPVPEPSTLALLGVSLTVLGIYRCRIV